ncbi:MAG: MarR family transcriptional regulator [bacterium]
MSDNLAADVARVLTALHDAGAWFRHGLTDQRIVELTGLSTARMLAACRAAEADGLIERRKDGEDQRITLLTTMGVARTRPDRPIEVEAQDKPGAA